MPFIGRKIDLGLGKETIRGTSVEPTFWVPKIDFTTEDKVEEVINEASIGVIEDAEGSKVVKKWSEGEIIGYVRDKSFGLILLAALGAVSSTAKEAPNADVYDHTFTIQQSAQHQSLTIGMKNPNEQLRFALAVLSNLELRCELGKFVEYTAGFLAKLGADETDTVSYTSENEFLAQHITFKLATNLAGLDAADAISVKKISLSIGKNVEADDILGNIAPADYLNKQIEITGEVELLYDATTYKDLFLAGTQKAMRIDIKNTDVTIGDSSNPELKIDLAKVKFMEWERGSGLNDITKETLRFKGFYSLSDSQAISVVLSNLQTSY